MTARIRATLTCLACLAAACSGATIRGDIVLGPGPDGLPVVAVLWSQRNETTANGTPRPRLTALGQITIGTSLEGGGRYAYAFGALEKGSYVVGAYLDANDDRDPTCDEHSWDFEHPVAVDPATDAGTLVFHDVFLAKSAPDLGTITGTLHMSAAARQLPVTLYLLDGPLGPSATRPLAQLDVCQGNEDVPFRFFNVPPGSAHLMATADVGQDDGSTDACADGMENDLYAFAPVVTAQAGATASGVELWLDRDSPGGVLAGNVVPSARLPGLRLQLAVFQADPLQNRDAGIVGMLDVAAGADSAVPFAVGALPLGRLYLVGFPRTREAGCRVLRSSAVYARSGLGVAAVELSSDRPSQRDIVFPVGVGRVSGHIVLTNAPASLARVFVAASVPGLAGPDVRQLDTYEGSVTDGVFRADYELFGLEDGRFDMAVVPDVSGDGWLDDEWQRGYQFPGAPPSIEIVGGDRKGCDFLLDLPE